MPLYTECLWSILFTAELANRDTLIADLWEKGTRGVIEDAGGLRAFFEDAVQPENICSAIKARASDLRHEIEFNSSHVPDEHWDAVLAGKRFFITPACYRGKVPSGRLHLPIETTNAFGTGRHESTQLVLEALETYVAPSHTVLDVGCGSGILSAAATLLGASAVYSCDIHPDALSAARRRIQTPLFAGSADAVRSGLADIVVANISAAVLDRIAADLRRVAKPQGTIIVSGFVQENVPKRYTPDRTMERAGWLCWICRPEGIDWSRNDETDPNFHPQSWWL